MTLYDFPQETVNDMMVLIECKGTETERLLGAYDSEIEAYKIYKRVSHDDDR